jgi:CobQ-like glutamine amidotransferase family enzyme
MSGETNSGDPSRSDTSRRAQIKVVHIYPREMSIYGDLGNTRALASRLRWHGYEPAVHQHHPGNDFPMDAHLVLGGGGQDSGQARVEDDLAHNAQALRTLAADGTPMLMICGMYQLFGNAFITVEGERLPGIGILDVTTHGNAKRMIGPVVLETAYGDVVGYENHSGSTQLAPGQQPFGRVKSGMGNNGKDGTEGAVRDNVIGTYLHGPLLPKNAWLADHLIALALERRYGTKPALEPLPDELEAAAHESARKAATA